jgi:hypothetical protein
MIKGAAYEQFEAGFLKEAEAQGCDVDFLKGMLKEAEEVQNYWTTTLAEFEKQSGDPLFRMKLAGDLVSLINYRTANNLGGWEKLGFDINSFLHQAQQGIGKGLGVGDTAAGAIGGGGMGSILGLILGQLLGNPMLGLMLGGLGGAGIGALYSSGELHNLLAQHGVDPSKADEIHQTTQQVSQQTGGASDHPDPKAQAAVKQNGPQLAPQSMINPTDTEGAAHMGVPTHPTADAQPSKLQNAPDTQMHAHPNAALTSNPTDTEGAAHAGVPTADKPSSSPSMVQNDPEAEALQRSQGHDLAGQLHQQINKDYTSTGGQFSASDLMAGPQAAGRGIAHGAQAAGQGIAHGAQAAGQYAKDAGQGALSYAQQGANAVNQGAQNVSDAAIHGAQATGRAVGGFFKGPQAPQASAGPVNLKPIQNTRMPNVPFNKHVPSLGKPPGGGGLGNVQPAQPGSLMRPKVGSWDDRLNYFLSKVAQGLMEGMAFSNTAPSGPTTPSSGPVFGQAQTTDANPLLPVGAPMVMPPNQASMTPGGATMTNKRPIRQIF